jgi:uncharacterized membrane protein YbhN (UPF0104 family)
MLKKELPLIFWIKLIGFITTIIIVITYVDTRKFFSILINAHSQYLGLSCISLFLIIPFAALRLKLFLLSGGIQKSLALCTKSFLSGMSMNLLIPARGGDIAKVIFLKESENEKVSTMTYLCILERLADIICLSLIGIVSSILTKSLIPSLLSSFFLILSFFALVLILKTNKIPLLKKEIIEQIESGIKCFKNKKIIFCAFGASFVCCINNIMLMGLLLKTVYIESPMLQVFATSPTASIVGALPLTPMGMGTRDGALVYLLANHIPKESALAGSFLYMVSSQIFIGIIGMPIIFRKRKLKCQTS